MSQVFALALTLALEIPIVLALTWRIERDHVRVVLIAAAASLLTHPFAWWANESLLDLPFYTVRAPLIEGAVVVAEGVLYRAVLCSTWPRALFVSALANTVSFALGLVVYYARASL
jgi:hypothetical protein